MNLNKLFPNEKDRKTAMNHLRSLSQNPDWQFMVEKIIKPDIEQLSSEILDTVFDDLEQEKDLKRKRAYYIILSQLPEELVKALEEGKDEVLQFDPYFQSANEMKKR